MSSKRRYAILAVLFCAYLLCYLDRMAMASAIPFIAEEFGLSPLAMGGVLSAFFVGYSLMQLPGGLLADRFGPRRVLLASVLAWTVFTALTGAVNSLATMVLVRVLFGLSEGPFPPTASKTVALWFPPHEVGRANGMQLAAGNIGAAIAPVLVVPLIVHWGWRSVYLSLLIPGLVIAVLVWIVVRDAPPGVAHSRGDVEAPRLRLVELLRMPVVSWCCVTLFCVSIVGWGLMNWLPTYLLKARGFSVSKMGIYASLPFLAGAVGYYLGGVISDRYFSQRRQIPIRFALVLAGVMTYLAAIAPSGEWAVAALVVAFLCLFIASSGIFTLPLVIVPRGAVGGVFGIVNTAGQAAALLSPLLVGYVLNVSNGNFKLVFYCFVGLFGVAALAALRIKQPAAAPV